MVFPQLRLYSLNLKATYHNNRRWTRDWRADWLLLRYALSLFLAWVRYSFLSFRYDADVLSRSSWRVRRRWPSPPSVTTSSSNKQISNGHSTFTRKSTIHPLPNYRADERARYRLSYGCLLLLCGRLADIVGSKKMFIIGSAWFSVWWVIRRGFTVILSNHSSCFSGVLQPLLHPNLGLLSSFLECRG